MGKFVFKSYTRRGFSEGNQQRSGGDYGSQKKSKKVAPYVMHDNYFQRAKGEGYRARSAYKLIEIQDKFKLIHPDMKVCDVGAAPGSFIQYINKVIGSEGQIVGIDIKPIDHYSQENVNTIVHSIFDFDTLKPKVENYIGKGEEFDLITSDIGPNTTGRKDVDQYASVELNIEIVKFSVHFLKKGGNLLLKVFKGEDFCDLLNVINKEFETFTEYKPKACRDRSFEEYVICWKKF